MRVAALGAHPDDVEIFMGGAMLAWKAAGADIHFVVATDGRHGGKGDPDSLAKDRAGEAAEAAALAGATLHLVGWADGSLHPGAAETAGLKALFAEISPDLVVTHAASDYHSDHRALSAIASAAAGFRCPILWCDTPFGTGLTPTAYIDITKHFALKCRLIRCHRSQDPDRFVEMTTVQNRVRAGQCGGGADDRAEAYRFEPRFPFADIRSLLPPAPPVRPVTDRRMQDT